MRFSFLSVLCGSLAAVQAQFAVIPHQEEIAERGLVLQYLVRTENDSFRFSPPGSWTLAANPGEQTMVFRNERFEAALTLRFIAGPGALRADRIENAVLERFSGAKVIERYPCVARDAEGLCLELRFAAADGAPYAARVGTLSYEDSQMELTLVAPVASLPKAHAAWTAVLNSFRREAPEPKDKVVAQQQKRISAIPAGR